MSGDNDATACWARVCAVLDAVLDAPREDRARIVEQHCGDDPALRAEVEALLRAEALADARLESPVPDWAAALVDGETEADAAANRLAGTLVGPWRLVEELGRGGMGTVWLAERAAGDFEQRVALKLLKRGVDSDAILARFVAERRILARLEHPHIARLVDGGVSDDGRPWFAMELVDGAPITRWCDAQRLPVHGRVHLFLAVIDAVQHAHRQLIVHRDLKPSNILVARTGEVKLLDFGIAKLLDAQDERSDAETLTRLGWRMLTPEYAAPEQLRGDAVTTATDVYALGVLLYELLAGVRPPRARGDADAGVASTDRLAPRPSTQCAADAAETRATTLPRLVRSLRGDLDTIVLRALHPEPERRYGTAQAFGEDLRRHLDGRPVLARPDSAWYRARRFVARNRIGVTAAAMITLSLAGGLFATAWQAREARARAQEAEQQARRAEQVKAFLIEIFEAGGPQEWRGKEPTARELLDAGAKRVDEELTGDPALHAEMLAVIGDLYRQQGRPERAEPLLRRALDERRRLFGDDHEAYADSLYKWYGLLYARGDWNAAEQALQRAATIFRRRLGDHPQTSLALGGLSLMRLTRGDAEAAIRLRRQALDIDRLAYGNSHERVAENLRILGSLLVDRERYDEAAPLFEESLAITGKLYGDRSVRHALGLNAQALMLQRQGRIEQAAGAFRRVIDIYRDAGDPINLEDALNHYGVASCQLGRFGEAERNLRASLDLVKRNRAAPGRIGIRAVALGGCLTEAGRPAEAEPLLREGLAQVEQDVGPDHGWTPLSLATLAESLARQGKFEEARPLIERAHQLFERQFGADSAWTADSLRILANVRFASGEHEQGLSMARQALQTLQRGHGAAHPKVADAALVLSALELQSGQDRRAEARLLETGARLEVVGDIPGALTARMLRGVALSRLGRPAEGEALLRDAVGKRRAMYGASNAMTAESEIYLGDCLLRSGRRDEGIRLLERGRARFTEPSESGIPFVRLADAALAKLR